MADTKCRLDDTAASNKLRALGLEPGSKEWLRVAKARFVPDGDGYYIDMAVQSKPVKTK